MVDHIDFVMTLVGLPELFVRCKFCLNEFKTYRGDNRFHGFRLSSRFQTVLLYLLDRVAGKSYSKLLEDLVVHFAQHYC